ncbi:hypothetical protein HA466_0279620 [Hirschfeldia incana]|nr:hypothetical protein HA466_0279620 [Hirschfeldia incana]
MPASQDLRLNGFSAFQLRRSLFLLLKNFLCSSIASMVTAPSPSRSRPPPDRPPSFAMFVVVVRASPLELPKPPDLSIVSKAVNLFSSPFSLTQPLSSFAMFGVVVGSKPPKPPKQPDLSFIFSASLYSLDCAFGYSPIAIVRPSRAVCSPLTSVAVCSSTFGVFRKFSIED